MTSATCYRMRIMAKKNAQCWLRFIIDIHAKSKSPERHAQSTMFCATKWRLVFNKTKIISTWFGSKNHFHSHFLQKGLRRYNLSTPKLGLFSPWSLHKMKTRGMLQLGFIAHPGSSCKAAPSLASRASLLCASSGHNFETLPLLFLGIWEKTEQWKKNPSWVGFFRNYWVWMVPLSGRGNQFISTCDTTNWALTVIVQRHIS